MTLRVVVDASVAKAAGHARAAAGAPGPQAVAALNAIRESTLRVAMSREIKDEWQRHRREFATKWLRNMVAIRRFEPVRSRWAGEAALLDAAGDLPAKQRSEVAKDAHLVGTAMVTDGRVVSLDAAQRSLLKRLVPTVPAIGGIHWAIPTEAGVIDWLRESAPDRAALTLASI